MEIKDIIALANAGFNAEQIMRINESIKPPETVEKPVEKVEKNPFNQMMEKMDSLISTIKTSNINNSSQPEQMSMDDFLASIINPPMKEDK